LMGVQEEEFRQAMERLEREVLAMKSYLEQIIGDQQELLNIVRTPRTGLNQADSGDGDEVSRNGLDVGILLKLPDHLRKTMLALAKLIEGRADEVAQLTGRARAIESGYLNQLVRLGYVKKLRRKHQIFFVLGDGE